MIAGLNKEYGDVVESGLLFADPAVVDRETDELIEKALLQTLRIDSNTNKKLDGIMSLLFAERPLVINTQLAMKIGLNEAIVLQQLHYWLRDTNSGMECDGVRWIYNTTEQWLEQFPFWSESTLKRAFASLKTLGLLRCEKLNKSKRDMTNFYTINYGSEL